MLEQFIFSYEFVERTTLKPKRQRVRFFFLSRNYVILHKSVRTI